MSAELSPVCSASVHPALLHSYPSACFPWQKEKIKLACPWPPGASQGPLRNQALRNTTHFCGCFWLVACPVTSGLLGWIMPRVDLFLKSASCFPLLFNLGWLVALPGTRGGIHKPGSRMLVLRGQGCFPSRVGL